MLGSGIWSKITTAYSGATTAIAGATKLRLLNRIVVVVGLVSDIVISVIQSAAYLDPMVWMTETGMILFNLNGKLITNIATLQSGVPTWRAAQITVAIWGHLFVFIIGIKFFAWVAEEFFAGSDAPTLPEYAFIALFVLAPVQFASALLAQGLQGEGIGLTKEVVPYSGIYEVVTHADLWIEPLRQVIPDIAGFDLEGSVSSGNQTEGATVIE